MVERPALHLSITDDATWISVNANTEIYIADAPMPMTAMDTFAYVVDAQMTQDGLKLNRSKLCRF